MSIIPSSDRDGFSAERPRTCPGCGTVNPSRAGSCWRCHRSFGEEIPGIDVRLRNDPTLVAWDNLTEWTAFGALCGLVLLIAAELGYYGRGWDRALAVLLLIATIPALVRLALIAVASGGSGGALSVGQSIGAIFLGMVLAAAISGAAAIMFIVTCFPLGAGLPDGEIADTGVTGLVLAEIAGICVGGYIAFLLAKLFFQRDKPPDRPA